MPTIAGIFVNRLKDETGKVVTVIETLEVKGHVTLTAEYTVTQEDIDAQVSITNVAKATIPGENPTPSDPVPVVPVDEVKTVSSVKEISSIVRKGVEIKDEALKALKNKRYKNKDVSIEHFNETAEDYITNPILIQDNKILFYDDTNNLSKIDKDELPIIEIS